MRSTINKKSVKMLKKKRQAQDVEVVDDDCLVLPGPPLTDEQFREWILKRVNGPSISLEEAKARWAIRKQELLKLVK